MQTHTRRSQRSLRSSAAGRTRNGLRRCLVCRSSASVPPQVVQDVGPWAQRQFEQELDERPGDDIRLTRMCMLLALEEEAAAQAEGAFREVGTSSTGSTWSLARLDALAAEAMAHLATAAGSGGPTTAPTAAEEQPVAALAALNHVLFERHGYKACGRYGEASDSQLSSVLESGAGSSAALAIVYLEVAARMGLRLAASLLEGGRYVVLTPQTAAAQLRLAGSRFVVDPFGEGALLEVDEVCELFGVDEAGLAPASRRQLLASLLSDLVDSHWAAAVGCSPAPAFMLPLSLATALDCAAKLPRLDGGRLARALAAARKRLLLVPDHPPAQLQYALLLYFSGRYDDAWLELGIWLEQRPPGQELGRGPGAEDGPGAGPDAAASLRSSAAEQQVGGTVDGGGTAVIAGGSSGGLDAGEEGGAPAGGDGEYGRALVLLEKLRLELAMRDVAAGSGGS